MKKHYITPAITAEQFYWEHPVAQFVVVSGSIGEDDGEARGRDFGANEPWDEAETWDDTWQ